VSAGWEILVPSSEAIATQRDTIKRLQTAVSGHPYYKYNGMWSRELQNIVRWLIPHDRDHKALTSISASPSSSATGSAKTPDTVSYAQSKKSETSLRVRSTKFLQSPTHLIPHNSTRQSQNGRLLPPHHRRIPARAHISHRRARPSSRQRCHSGRLRATTADQQVCEGFACGISDTESEE